jgi:hypothetical protein
MKIRSAQAILTEIREGAVLEELAQAFHDAIANVREHGKPVTIVVTIRVGALGEGQHKLVEPPVIIKGKVETKLYEPEPPATVFFIDSDGNATRNQSRQTEIALTVAGATTEGSKA